MSPHMSQPENGGCLDEPTPADVSAMVRALELARLAAEQGEVPVGAVVYELETGRIIGEGYNLRETDADPSAHAEVVAIRQAARHTGTWRLDGCALVVTLEPCTMCAGLVVNARIGRLVYGAKDPKAGATGSLYAITEDARLNHRVRPISGVMAEESAELLRDFFRARRSRGQTPGHTNNDGSNTAGPEDHHNDNRGSGCA